MPPNRTNANHVTNLEVSFDLLNDNTNLDILGDKGYISADKATELFKMNRLGLRTLPRNNQKKQLPSEIRHLFNAVRQIVEIVNGLLHEQFNIEKNHGDTFWGLMTRLYTKLTAHTMCLFINRLLGKSELLQIKSLAFPI